MKKKALIMSACIAFLGCLDTGNSEINNVLPDWGYIRSDAPGYKERDRTESGNCFDYAVAAYNELLRAGYDKSRLTFQACKIDSKGHMALLVDHHKVYSVGEQWVLEKDSLDWEWVGVEME